MMISVDLSMEMRVGSWVMVTARVMNQKASKVITAATGRARAEDSGMARGSVISLLGRNTVEVRARRTEKTPVMRTRWVVLTLSLLLLILTLITLDTATLAATNRQRPTPRKY